MFEMSEVSAHRRSVKPTVLVQVGHPVLGVIYLYNAVGVCVYFCLHGSHNVWKNTDMNLKLGR